MQLYADFLPSTSTETRFSLVLAIGKFFAKFFLNPDKVELAKETDNPPDSAHLRNSFTSEWKPKTIDDYISAYLGGLARVFLVFTYTTRKTVKTQ